MLEGAGALPEGAGSVDVAVAVGTSDAPELGASVVGTSVGCVSAPLHPAAATETAAIAATANEPRRAQNGQAVPWETWRRQRGQGSRRMPAS